MVKFCSSEKLIQGNSVNLWKRHDREKSLWLKSSTENSDVTEGTSYKIMTDEICLTDTTDEKEILKFLKFLIFAEFHVTLSLPYLSNITLKKA